jgi:Flp pilus assembly protein TadG
MARVQFLSLRRLAGDRRGNVAMLWALASTVTLSLVGLSIDFSRAHAVRTQVQNAADAAALVAERMANRPLLERRAAAEQYFRASLEDLPHASLATISIEEVPGGGHRAVATMPSPTTLSRLVTGRDFTVAAASTADESSGPVEVALVLDNTGSMSNDMDALRSSAEELVNTVFDAAEAPGLVEMAVVPFVAQVNIGNSPTQMDWLDVAGDAPFNGELLEGRMLGRTTAWTASMGATCQNLSTLPYAGYPGTLRLRWVRGDANGAPASSGTTYCYAYAPDTINYFELHALTQHSSWKGCVEARPAPYDITDDPPNPAIPATMFVPFFWIDNLDGLGNSYLADNAGDMNVAGATGFAMRGSASGTGYTRTQQGRYFNPFKYRNNNAALDTTAPDTTGPNRGCPTPIVPLTPVKAQVVDGVRDMVHWSGGGTNQTEGLAWGWRVLSPTAPFTEGAAYGVKKKVLVLMSDGQNTNIGTGSGNNPIMGSDYSSYSHLSQWTQSGATPRGWRDTLPAAHRRDSITSSSQYVNYINTREGQLCTAIKAAGIEIFTVIFRESNGTARDIMRACASPDVAGIQHYHTADDQAQLRAAFQNIGSSIGKLRLVH